MGVDRRGIDLRLSDPDAVGISRGSDESEVVEFPELPRGETSTISISNKFKMYLFHGIGI